MFKRSNWNRDNGYIVTCLCWKIFKSSSQHFNYCCANKRIIFWKPHHVFIYSVPREFFGPRLFQELEDTLFGKVNHDNGLTLMILLFQKESGIIVLLFMSNVTKMITDLSLNIILDYLLNKTWRGANDQVCFNKNGKIIKNQHEHNQAVK